MKIQAMDLLVLLDAAAAICRVFERDGGYQHMGCKYTREAIIEAFDRVNNAIGEIPVQIGDKDEPSEASDSGKDRPEHAEGEDSGTSSTR
jgi:hypothetical protein